MERWSDAAFLVQTWPHLAETPLSKRLHHHVLVDDGRPRGILAELKPLRLLGEAVHVLDGLMHLDVNTKIIDTARMRTSTRRLSLVGALIAYTHWLCDPGSPCGSQRGDRRADSEQQGCAVSGVSVSRLATAKLAGGCQLGSLPATMLLSGRKHSRPNLAV